MIPLMNPGVDPTAVVYNPDMACVPETMVIQYHTSSEAELHGYLGVSRATNVIVPGKDPAHTRLLYVKLQTPEVAELIAKFGRYPRFTAMTVPRRGVW